MMTVSRMYFSNNGFNDHEDYVTEIEDAPYLASMEIEMRKLREQPEIAKKGNEELSKHSKGGRTRSLR
jgi:hypothetical protein